MAGADVANVCSLLLQTARQDRRAGQGPRAAGWKQHEYESVAQMKGALSQRSCPEPAAFERANYMKALTGYKVQW